MGCVIREFLGRLAQMQFIQMQSLQETMHASNCYASEDYVNYVMYYDADVEANRNIWTRQLYRKVLNIEFHFTEIIGT